MQLRYESEIALLVTYSREMKVYVHTKICTWKFKASLFIRAKN